MGLITDPIDKIGENAKKAADEAIAKQKAELAKQKAKKG